ncbi:MAG: HRDC domain-containing protein, partial [Verrucomicrobia bacterium]|nr:HRDC domain-containing protein [Verrucomicrobiota bacterium]
LTSDGLAFLKSREVQLELTKPTQAAAPRVPRDSKGHIDCDEKLFQRLRDLRKNLADDLDVPAYIIFSDVALRHMARDYPASPDEFLQIPGVGEKKLEDFGEDFMNEIEEYLENHPRQNFD